MTNEEMALEIQSGQMGYNALWEQNRKFFTQKAYRFRRSHASTCERAGVEMDDLIQCGFLALCDGVNAYKPESGYKLLTFTEKPLQTHYAAACGIRTSRRDPLNTCDSLDRKLTGIEGDSDTSVFEVTEDKLATAEMEDALERIYNDELHAALEVALDAIPGELADTLRRRYFDGLTISEVAAAQGIPIAQARDNERRAMVQIRKPHVCGHLQPYRDNLMIYQRRTLTDFAWRGSGINAWYDFGISSVERAVESAEKP